MKTKQIVTEALEYPKLRATKHGMVVLFIQDNIGTVVHLGDCKTHSLGEASSAWVFVDFEDVPVGEGVSIKN